MPNDPRPILSAIRALLKFRDSTTIPEIAQMAGCKPRHVLDVVNRNTTLVRRDRQKGRITGAHPQHVLTQALREGGQVYWDTEMDYARVPAYDFKGHAELRAQLETKTWGGGLGDSYPYSYVPRTPENEAAIRAAGMVRLDEPGVVDDRLWIEAP